MSEKRFTLNLMKKPSEIEMDGKMISKYDVVRLLNEQQATISQLKEENEQLKKENNDYEKQFRIINEKLDEYIKTADTYRIPISSLKYGDELGYFNGVYQYMKKMKKDIGGIGMSKRFQKTRIVDKWGGIYDSETDKVLNVNDVEHKLNEQQNTITKLEIELTDCKNRKEQSEYNLQKRIDEQEKIIKEQTLRTYCQDKEIQKLMGQLEKIPQSIREVWIDEQETE